MSTVMEVTVHVRFDDAQIERLESLLAQRLGVPEPEPADERLLTVEEVAERAGLSRAVVRRAVRDGELRAVKVRSRVRVRDADYEAWLLHGIMVAP